MIRGLLMSNMPGAVENVRDTIQTVESIAPRTTKKVKKKVSKYSRQLGIELKRLKRKHPRTRISSLMKRAHRATKKAIK